MTYQMIQSVAVTGDIYQQFISYLLHESDTILLGTQNRERRLDGGSVSPTLIKQYEELQMFTILNVKWCQVKPDYLYDKVAEVSGLQQLVELLQVECLAFAKLDEILFTVEWDCYHGCVIREDVSEYFSALQKEQPVFYDLMGKLDIDHLEQAWNKYQLPVDKEMQSRILATAYVGIFLLRDVLSADELERWKCFVYEKENLFSEFPILCAFQGLLENVFLQADRAFVQNPDHDIIVMVYYFLKKNKRRFEKAKSEVLRKASRYFPYSDAVNESMVRQIKNYRLAK